MLDLTGKTFGRLTVLRKLEARKHGQVMWKCQCACGTIKEVKAGYLASGRTRSCGCLRSDFLKENKPGTVHGRSDDPAYRLWVGAKYRANKSGLDFNIDLEDVVIPVTCPVLGIPLVAGVGRHIDSSPSLDRVDNTKGYVKGNVLVISRRANCIKNDATLEELKAVVTYVETTRKEK